LNLESGEPAVKGAPNPQRLKITWLLPGIVIGGGGHRNILRAAHHLSSFGHEVRIEVLDTEKSSLELSETIRKHFYPFAGQIKKFDGSIEPTDVLFATHWSTVEPSLALRSRARELIYFVQDFEPYFYPMGSDYIRAENTYRIGLYAICSGAWCANLLRRDYGAAADSFEFPIDTSVYYPPENRSFDLGKGGRVVYFAKPDMPRRCFELGLDALTRLKALRPNVRITLFGSNALRRMQMPFQCEVLGLTPTIADLAKVYRTSDVGVAFSPTNPSLTPYEMMACGLPVVDLERRDAEINYGGRRDVAYLSDPRPDLMAMQIDALLDNVTERAERSAQGITLTSKMPSEEGMARRIEALIRQRVAVKAS
jgi:glycosyltransferase involved in cell wall biosynthesis